MPQPCNHAINPSMHSPIPLHKAADTKMNTRRIQLGTKECSLLAQQRDTRTTRRHKGRFFLRDPTPVETLNRTSPYMIYLKGTAISI